MQQFVLGSEILSTAAPAHHAAIVAGLTKPVVFKTHVETFYFPWFKVTGYEPHGGPKHGQFHSAIRRRQRAAEWLARQWKLQGLSVKEERIPPPNIPPPNLKGQP